MLVLYMHMKITVCTVMVKLFILAGFAALTPQAQAWQEAAYVMGFCNAHLTTEAKVSFHRQIAANPVEENVKALNEAYYEGVDDGYEIKPTLDFCLQLFKETKEKINATD